PMAAQFIDLAREITHSPFPNQLRSVTWPSDPLLSESAMNQTGATPQGKRSKLEAEIQGR
ncbi:hypothetical protein, partial [Aeromonas caviae]